MSLVIEKFITCDGNAEDCLNSFGVDDRAQAHSISLMRKEAKDEGWTFKNGKDYCPNCKPTK